VPWTEDDIPDQSGRTVFVTGATDGLGLRSATVLASKGARVLLSFRDRERGLSAFEQVRAASSGPEPELVPLDLASQSSVTASALEVRERSGDRLDLLVNCGGIMAPPLAYSSDGLELQWATNVVGHVALTWQLLPALLPVSGSRVVGVSSIAHWFSRFDQERLLADLRGERYRRFLYYCRTKLADLVFSRELQRRLAARGENTISVSAHPGLAATNIATSTTARSPAPVRALVVGTYKAVSQPVARASLPVLFAATRPGLRGAELIGPDSWIQTRGYPRLVRSTRASRDRRLGALLWDELRVVTGLDPGLTPP
jgi:NAD(P)-dependent dehydrogenase (short-subunit alcohol dehydrogenase family)